MKATTKSTYRVTDEELDTLIDFLVGDMQEMERGTGALKQAQLNALIELRERRESKA